MTYNIIDFGAVSDGKTLCTTALQKAIDQCSADGGGRVLIPAGRFISGSIYLKSGVDLHLEMGAELLASGNLDDYNPLDAYPQNADGLSENWVGKHLIMVIEQENVAITGLGKINGNGESFLVSSVAPAREMPYVWMDGVREVKDKEKLRPGQLICFIESKNLFVSDITIVNAPCWCLFFHGCENVRVRGLYIDNDKTFLNTDGIDIDCSRFVTVSDCNIKTGDDCIAIRTGSARIKNKLPCEYITVNNCNFSSSASGFRIGVGTGHIRHVRVSGITIEKTAFPLNFMTAYRGRGEAFIEDVNFSDISVTYCAFPILLQGECGAIRDITIENYRANSIASVRIDPESPCEGKERVLPDSLCDIGNITIKDTEINIIKEEREVTEEMKDYRGREMVYVGPCGPVRFENFRLTSENEEDFEKRISVSEKADVRFIGCEI